MDMMGLGGTNEQCTIYLSDNDVRIEKQTSPVGIVGMFEYIDLENSTISLRPAQSDTVIYLDTLNWTYCFINIIDVLKPLPKDTNTYVSFDVSNDSIPDHLDWIETVDSTLVVDTVNGYYFRSIRLYAWGINPVTSDATIASFFEVWLCRDVPGTELYLQNKRIEQRTLGIPDLAERLGVFDIIRR